jgi:hypothetical protein
MDRAGLLLARGFLKDRVSKLQEQSERAELESMEIRRQLRLEAKAREALVSYGSQVVQGNPAGLGLKVLERNGGQGRTRLSVLEKAQALQRLRLDETRRYLKKVEERLKV